MLKVGADVKLVAQQIRSETGKTVINKQIHNIKQKYQKMEENYTGDDVEDVKNVRILMKKSKKLITI